MIQRYFEAGDRPTPERHRARRDPRGRSRRALSSARKHTQERYATAFYAPFVSDWRNFEAWRDRGSIWTPERANRIYKEILAEFEPPPMNAAIKQELAEFVERRKHEGGAPTDF